MEDTYRLTFAEQNDRIELMSVQRLGMRAPPGQDSEEFSQVLDGRFVELRDERGRILYRRGINGEFPPTLEYPTDDASPPFERVKAKTRRIVSILVPALSGGRAVSLIEMPPNTEGTPEPIELISVSLID